MMKNIIYLFSLLLFSAGYAQDTQQNRNNERNNRAQERSNRMQERTDINRPSVYIAMRDREEFTSNNEKYTFTRDGNNGMKISRRNTNGQEENFGRLKRTTTDGLYIMTSTSGQDVSFGQFDSSGNFRTYRYDAVNDTVVEQEFINSEPMDFNKNKAREMRRTKSNATRRNPNTNNTKGNNNRNL